MAKNDEKILYSRIMDAAEKKPELRQDLLNTDEQERLLRSQLIIAFHTMLDDRQEDSSIYLRVAEGPLTPVDHILFSMPLSQLSKKLNEVADTVILLMPAKTRFFVRRLLEG